LVTVIKTSWLRWLGYVRRIEKQRDPKRALEGKPGGRRKPQKRRSDNVEDELTKMGVKKGRIQTTDRNM
jgi:hypothetical protein